MNFKAEYTGSADSEISSFSIELDDTDERSCEAGGTSGMGYFFPVTYILGSMTRGCVARANAS